MAKFHLPTIEAEQQKKWDDRKVFAQILARNAETDRKPFVFFEGPPTANNKPGIHHMLGRSLKDVFLRFRTMQGYRIDRKAGWDTHGLPVELEVEKQLGFTKKQDIENFGVAAFNEKCRESVWTYQALWEKSTKKLGFWVDLEHPYITYKNDYVESLWWILQQVAHKKSDDGRDMLYQGYRVTPHCPRCVTSLSSHELAQGYKDVKDPSVFVKFAVAGRENTFFLVWTTTPWTLSGNVALAVGPEVTYVEAKMAAGETFILAKERVSVLEGEYSLGEEKTGSQLAGTAYVPLYDVMPADEKHRANAYQVYGTDFVSTGDGTGIVHIAPAFGEDDAQLGNKASLPTLHTVDNTGMVTSDSPGKGLFFKKADDAVKEDLTSRGLLYKSEMVLHSYPFCWRCDSPILYYAKASWYIRMSALRDKLIANNNQVNWIPEHIKDGRFGEWLKDVKDWAISRERYWGTPLPIWKCDACEKTRVIGSLGELDAAGSEKNTFFLQRHGEAEHNVRDIVAGWPEQEPIHLTEKGRAEVLASAKELKEKGIDMIFASDVTRTRETAELIAKELGLEITFDPRLRELDFGDLNFTPVKEFHAKAEGLDRFTQQVAGTGETLNDVRRRVMAFMKDMRAAHSGKRILVVSHGDPLWMMQTLCKGLTKDEIRSWPHYNGLGQFVEMEEPKNLPYDTLGEVDVHRPFIDEVTMVCDCGGTQRRVQDVCDVWFDSGAMPFAQWGYPHNAAEKGRVDNGTNFPAEYICEAIDQTRGWFYTLLAVSTLLGKDVPPYKNVICTGHVLDAKGQKMSKSKGNGVDPFVAMDQYGADVLRWYFYSVNQPGDSKRWDPKAVEDVTKKVYLILWNVLSFWQMYAAGNAAPTDAPAPTHELDRWILAQLAALNADVTAKMEAYDAFSSSRAIAGFIDDLSTWYVRRSRDRFKAGGDDAAAATATLGFTLRSLAHLMAPFAPHLADQLYAEVGGNGDSVHLAEWPTAAFADPVIITDMWRVRKAASFGLEQRAAAGIPVRQALSKATLSESSEYAEWMCEMLADELNVEKVVWQKGTDAIGTVTLDTVITPELRRKGAARELTRTINDLRKQAGLTVADRVVVQYETTGDFWPAVLQEHGETLRAGVKADALEAAAVEAGEGSGDLVAEGQSFRVRIVKKG